MKKFINSIFIIICLMFFGGIYSESSLVMNKSVNLKFFKKGEKVCFIEGINRRK